MRWFPYLASLAGMFRGTPQNSRREFDSTTIRVYEIPMFGDSPYAKLPRKSFWRTGVCEVDWDGPTDLYNKKFEVHKESGVMTAGSCFAQHISRYMRRNGFSVIDTEPPPPGLTDADAREFGYGLYSARYGNIYTARQLLQLIQEATGSFTPSNAIWSNKDGRHCDAMRPSVEPNGLDSPGEVDAQRKDHLSRVRTALESTDVFVFTFGLTEAWVHEASGTVYPTAPGTIAGGFDPNVYVFKNFTFAEIYQDFIAFREILKKIRPNVQFLITVSPVPLTATASAEHVLPATIYSKSVLRAVAGQLAAEFPDIDYFPSYEIVATPFLGRMFYDANLRTVLPEGVETVMRIFFRQHDAFQEVPAEEPESSEQAIRKGPRPQGDARKAAQQAEEDLVCEEILLDAFSR